MDKSYDIVVIGSGPGGYTAAIKAAQLGYKVAIVEKYDALGGTCTNVGCIPAKALLDSSEHYHNAKAIFEVHGIELNNGVNLNFGQFIKRKTDVVAANVAGLNYLMKKNKIAVHHGTASFLSSANLLVKNDSDTDILTSKYFIIATGSKPASIPGVTIDKKRIITSAESLSLSELPKSLVIIGGGVIGVEMASIFARLGSEVTIMEYTDSLIPTMDRELGKALLKVLEKLQIKVLLKCKVQSATSTDSNVVVNFLDSSGTSTDVNAAFCLVATGRKANTKDLNLAAAGLKTEPNGSITVDQNLQTSVPGIYAIGDVVRGPMLAHKAEDEAICAVEIINGQKPHVDYNLIPSVVYTWPEVASVGMSEEQLKNASVPYRAGKFPYSASGRARASGDTDGFAKVLVSPQYGEVLGVHIIGPRAADVIAQCVLGMAYEVTAEDMYRISYAHPTYAEALKDTFLIADGKGAINF
jgi:dihydrolipoamide dehydrogenase